MRKAWFHSPEAMEKLIEEGRRLFLQNGEKGDYYIPSIPKDGHPFDQRDWKEQLTARFFGIYGKKCVCCGESDFRFLTVYRVHTVSYFIDDDGHRKKSLWHPSHHCIVRDALEYPNFAEYETRCFNCNLGAYVMKNQRARRAKNDEQARTKADLQKRRADRISRRRIRERFFEVYGGRCACCGETRLECLTVGHKHNDGRDDRLQNGGAQGVTRLAVRHPDLTKYETQCWNCNMGTETNGSVCPHKTRDV